MLAGHLTFHPVALVPWVAWAALAPAASLRLAAGPAAFCGVLFAYMFHAGMVHGILPALLAEFPRADYALPGFSSLPSAGLFALQALFWRPPLHGIANLAGGRQWTIDVHELAFGVGPAALALLLAGGYAVARRGSLPGRPLAWAPMLAALAFPLALNWHFEPWRVFLKELPLFGSSANLLRWYAVYVPLAVVLAALALALDRITVAGWPRRLVALSLIALTAGWNALADDMARIEMTYDARPVQAACSPHTLMLAQPKVVQ